MSPLSSAGAFTLIELLVVISIVSVLMGILLPSLKRSREQAKDILCRTNLRSIHVAQMLYINPNGRFPRLNNDEDDGHWQYNYLIYDGRDFEHAFGPLVYDSDLLGDINLLFCPFQKSVFHTLNTLENPWPIQEGFDTRASYARRYRMSGRDITRYRNNVAVLADLIHLPKVVESAHGDGVNVAYLDGHVSWVPDTGLLTDNELGTPFDLADNAIIKKIWKLLDAAK